MDNDLDRLFDPYRCRQLLAELLTDWWPADHGDNKNGVDTFRRWAYEDPSNNLHTEPLFVAYHEPDLQITELVIPAGATSGETMPVTFTVTNLGTRNTRQDGRTGCSSRATFARRPRPATQ